MTLYEFNYLDELEQLQAVWGAVLLGERKDEEQDIRLYQIDSFYVEEYIHREKDSRVRFRSFSSTELLDAYISKFDLRDLNLNK